MSDETSARLHGLDAIRGVAALVVFIFHVDAGFQFPILFRKGYLAVDLFFMLSGYVLARTYEGRLREGMSAAQLLALRYRRLWPPMVIGCLCGLPLLAIDAGDWRTFGVVAVANFALLPMPLVGLAIMPLNPPGWSIYFELVANLFHRTLLGERRLVVALVISGALFAYAALQKGDANVGASIKNLVWGFPRVMF
ncbi:MAG: acyltransferase, partial [Sphingomonadales bacterium]|nr:acyltransferase [Sphingomonadales bacterium]